MSGPGVETDVQEGCEGAVEALRGWIDALARRDFDYLERHLAEDFQFTCDPRVHGGRLNKAAFIDMDKKIFNADIRLVGVAACARGSVVITQVFATVNEEFRGDLGEGMPSAEEMAESVNGKTLAYGSAWRCAEGRWQCFDHHVFGPVD